MKARQDPPLFTQAHTHVLATAVQNKADIKLFIRIVQFILLYLMLTALIETPLF